MDNPTKNDDLPRPELPEFLRRKEPPPSDFGRKIDWHTPRFVEYLNKVQRWQEGPRGLAPKVYGMTRRYSLRAVMLLMAVAAGILALLQFLGIDEVISASALVIMGPVARRKQSCTAEKGRDVRQ